MAKAKDSDQSDEQAIRNAHYREDGVDEQGNAPGVQASPAPEASE